MGQPVGIQINFLLAKKIQARADEVGIAPGQLIELYLEHCILRHKDVIKFEKAIEPKTIIARKKNEILS